jgi:hypothetical protein
MFWQCLAMSSFTVKKLKCPSTIYLAILIISSATFWHFSCGWGQTLCLKPRFRSLYHSQGVSSSYMGESTKSRRQSHQKYKVQSFPSFDRLHVVLGELPPTTEPINYAPKHRISYPEFGAIGLRSSNRHLDISHLNRSRIRTNFIHEKALSDGPNLNLARVLCCAIAGLTKSLPNPH